MDNTETDETDIVPKRALGFNLVLGIFAYLCFAFVLAVFLFNQFSSRNLLISISLAAAIAIATVWLLFFIIKLNRQAYLKLNLTTEIGVLIISMILSLQIAPVVFFAIFIPGFVILVLTLRGLVKDVLIVPKIKDDPEDVPYSVDFGYLFSKWFGAFVLGNLSIALVIWGAYISAEAKRVEYGSPITQSDPMLFAFAFINFLPFQMIIPAIWLIFFKFNFFKKWQIYLKIILELVIFLITLFVFSTNDGKIFLSIIISIGLSLIGFLSELAAMEEKIKEAHPDPDDNIGVV